MSNLRSVLQQQLRDTYQRHGELTPDIVVEEARPVEAPLHDRFEWDDATAGEEYRRIQAAELIRSVRIEYAHSPEPKSVREWVARRDVGREPGGYLPAEEVVQDDVAMKVLQRQFEREVRELQRKYGHLAEFAETLRAVAS